MPLFQTDDQISERLKDDRNVIFKLIGSGRSKNESGENGKTPVHLDTDTKAFIGKLAIIDGTNGAAKFSGLHPNQVSDIKNGRMRNHENEEVQEKITESLKGTRELAIGKLVNMMQSMTPEKIKDMPVLAAAVAAEKIAGVHERLSSKSPNGPVIGAQVIYFSPRPKTEADYPAIEAEVISR